METRPTTTANPPSVEIAYKRKCAALKKRLAEVEAENELMRTRNLRGYQYIQKMRLESCMLLERLAKVTGMADEAAAGTADPELRARAAAMMSNAAVLNGLGASGASQGANGGYLEDETEGSSDEQPPTVRSILFRSGLICSGLLGLSGLVPWAAFSAFRGIGLILQTELPANLYLSHSPKNAPSASSAPVNRTCLPRAATRISPPKTTPARREMVTRIPPLYRA